MKTLEYLEPSPTGTWREAEVLRMTDDWFAQNDPKRLDHMPFFIYGRMRQWLLDEAADLERQYPERRDEIRLHYGIGLGKPSNSCFPILQNGE